MTRKFVKKLGGSFFARRLEGGVYIEGFPAVSPKCHLIIFSIYTWRCIALCHHQCIAQGLAANWDVGCPSGR